jgi:phosphoribosylanthranilate isomerase
MDASSVVRIKICCIMSYEEARIAVRAGADAVGLVGKMPSGPGPIDDGLIGDIARSVPPPVATVLLTSEQSVDGVVAHHRRVRTSVIQLVDVMTTGSPAELRDRLPGVKLMQVIHVTGIDDLAQAEAAARFADALLLDSGRPDLAVKELGGTGRVHNWEISRKIRESVGVPVFLAGGLHPGNVREAIETVRPFGVDVCSGVRTRGRLDQEKVSAFCAAVLGCTAG